MTGLQLVLPDRLRSKLVEHLIARRDIESHAFLFGGVSNDRITVGRLWLTPGPMYQHRSAGGIHVRKDYAVQAMEYATQNGFALIDAHSHPMASSAQFSSTDDFYGTQTGRWMARQVGKGELPEVPWGMLVVSGDGLVSARVFDYRSDTFARCAVLSPAAYQTGDDAAPAALYARHLSVWGAAGQSRLGRTLVAVVGLGGLGVLLAEQLARLGVRRFIVVDGDTVEESNLPRLPGFFREHIGKKKADVLRRHLKRIAGKAAEIRVCRDFLSRANVDCIRDADLIVGAVDRDGPRLLMNEIAVRYLTPYFDLGSGIHTVKGSVEQMGGQVKFVNPGTTSCLQCYGRLNSVQAAIDLMTGEELLERRRFGYVDDSASAPAASVIPLNTVVAGLGAMEISKLVTGFHAPSTYVLINTLLPEVRALDPADLIPVETCPVCGIGGALGFAAIARERLTTDTDARRLNALLERAKGREKTAESGAAAPARIGAVPAGVVDEPGDSPEAT